MIRPRNGKTAIPARRGYTLLELILALAISLVLLAALYLTLSTQIGLAQSARETVEDGTLARAILTRIANDVLGHLGPVDPRVLPASGTGSDDADADPAPTTAGTNGSTSGTNSSSSSSNSGSSTSGSSPPASMAPSASVGGVKFNVGVQGDGAKLMLAASRVPRELNLTGAMGAGVQPKEVSDLRRIAYWVASDGGQSLGLARQELVQVTSQDAATNPWDAANPQALIIAPEVKSISFEFFDGKSWQPTWDGTGDGSGINSLVSTTPIGPPAAIAINLEIRRTYLDNGEKKERVTSYRHVVQVPAGNNYSLPATMP